MKRRAIEICVVGLLDLAYRLFLRDIVRRRIGMETSTTRLASLAPPAPRVWTRAAPRTPGAAPR